jgi:GT2 family glycosyltransferase
MIETSAAGGGEAAKPWAFEAGKRAVQAHCERIGLPARVERDEADAGVYHLQPALVEQPLVSIIIPTNGQVRDIRFERQVLVTHCVRSIVEKSTYANYEIVVVADKPTPIDVIEELREIAGERLRLVSYDRPFNFSSKINLGAVRSEGEHLLLLNDDMEVVTPDWLERMVMYSAMPDIGAVGGRLLWENGRLQHVVVRFEHGLPGHLYRGFAGDFKGYANDVRIAQNCLAVTGACLMTRRDLFEEVGGLCTMLPVNYNDIDYCLKQRAKGRRVAYDPDLVMYHFESSSRSTEVEDWEKDRLQDRWLPLMAVDPYSNPNLHHGAPRLSSPFGWMRRRRPRLRRRQPKRQPA